MEESSEENIISLVNSIFQVSNFTKTEFSLEFRIDNIEFKSKFEELARILEDMNHVCKLENVENNKYIIIQKLPTRKQRKWLKSTWVPRALFGVVIVFVMIDGYYRTEEFNTIAFIGEPLEMATIYTLSLLGILGVHELGHLVASRYHKLKYNMAILYSRNSNIWTSSNFWGTYPIKRVNY